MRLYGVLATTSVLLILGCQGGSTATAPEGGGASPQPEAASVDQPLVIGTAEGSQSGVFGLYQLTVGTDASGQLAGSVTPAVRGAAARGDNYAIDATGFFTASPCGDCLRVVGLRQDVDGNVVANLELTHPFALPPQPEPLSSRLDLHAFDVMGYIITDGGGGSPLTFSDGADVAPPVLLNADGYSDLYDAVLEQYLPSPNVSDHPYRVFFRDDTAGNFAVGNPNGFADLRDPQGHNVIAMGEVDAIDYAFDIPDGGQISVGLAIGASWGQGAKGAGTALGQRLNPVFFAYEFHHKAPWMVTAQIANNNLEEGNLTSNTEIWIRLRDWQIGAVVDPAFDVLTTPVDQIRAASEVQDLTIEIPGLIASPIVLDPSTPGVGTGLFDDAIWTTLITNANNAPAGTYYAWVRARDERVPLPAAGLDRSLTPFTVSNFHTGALVAVEVQPVLNTAPTAALSPDPIDTCVCGTVLLDASLSSDVETPFANLLFEFDFDLPTGDPLNFASDTPQTTTPTASNQYCTLGTSFAAVRVTDEGGASDIAVVPVTVGGGAISPQPSVLVLPAATHPNQSIQVGGGISSPQRMTVAGNTIYVIVTSNVVNAQTVHLYRSSDAGQTWTAGTPLNRAWPTGNMSGMEIVVASPNGTVYIGTDQVRTGPSPNTELAIWSSTNNGTDPWVQNYVDNAGNKHGFSGAVDPLDPNRAVFAYMTGGPSSRAVRTTNGGAGPFTVVNWPTNCAGGFGGSVFYGANNRVYHVSHRVDQICAGVGTTGATYVRRSDDGGATFPNLFEVTHAPGSRPFAGGRGMADPMDPTGLTFTYALSYDTPSNVIAIWSDTGGATAQFRSLGLNTATTQAYYQQVGAYYDAAGYLYVYWNTNGSASPASAVQARRSIDDGQSWDPVVTIVPGGLAVASTTAPAGNGCDFITLSQPSGFGAINATVW